MTTATLTKSRWTRTFLMLTALAVTLPVSTAAAQDEGGGLQGIFGGNPKPATGKKLDTDGDITALLKSAGLEPEVLESGLNRVKVKEGVWTFPIVSFLSKDKSQLWLVTLLDNVDAKTDAVKLLEANYQHGPAHFSVNPKNQMIYFSLALANDGSIKPDQVKTEIDYLKRISDKTSNLWARESEDTPPPVTTPVHVGNWSASAKEGAETWSLILRADGTYQLTYANTTAKVNNTSKGNYTLKDKNLEFKSDVGDNLSGTVAFEGDRKFVFRVNGSPATAPGISFTKN